MNKIIIIGNLGRDPEMRYSTSGNPMTSFSIATNRRYTVNGEQREQTEWFNCTAYGRLADTCNQFLSRGQQVYVEGRLSTRQYERRDGGPGFSLDVFVTDVQFLGRRGDQTDDSSYGDYGGQSDRGYGDRGDSGGSNDQRGGYGDQRGGYDDRRGAGSGAGSGGDPMDVDDLPF